MLYIADIKGRYMVDGMGNIEETDFQCTIIRAKKIMDHIKKKQEEEYISHKKLSLKEHDKLSDYGKCIKSTLVRSTLFMLCSLGLGKSICESYDNIKREEDRLGRKLTDYEIYQIVTKVTKKYDIISSGCTD